MKAVSAFSMLLLILCLKSPNYVQQIEPEEPAVNPFKTAFNAPKNEYGEVHEEYTEIQPNEPQDAISVGECLVTYYCCEKYPHICGCGDGITATGVEVKPGIISVDPSVIPLHSDVFVDGVWYKAEDTGGAITGNRVDIAVLTHEEALQLGVKYAEVKYIPPEG